MQHPGQTRSLVGQGLFKHYDKPVERVDLMAFKASTGANPQALIKVCKAASQDFGHAPTGVPVVVFTEGTQGVTCLMRIDDADDNTIQQVIERGPYNRKRNGKPDHPADVTLHDQQNSLGQYGFVVPHLSELLGSEYAEAGTPQTEQCTVDAPATPAPVVTARSILSPYERLVRAGFADEEIERLKETLASIVYREIGEGAVPVAIQVPVTKITKAIIEHMKIPHNEAGNYRGKIGGFYSSRISLFGIKLDDSLDPNDLYTDWLLDTVVILDFIGGTHSLAALTRKRETEVSEREKTEMEVSAPAPTADAVEELVEKVVAEEDGWAASVAALDIAVKMHEGRIKAEERLAHAQENAEAQRTIVANLTEALSRARGDLNAAEALVVEAEQDVEQYVLRPDVAEKLRHMKERLLELAQRFNI